MPASGRNLTVDEIVREIEARIEALLRQSPAPHAVIGALQDLLDWIGAQKYRHP